VDKFKENHGRLPAAQEISGEVGASLEINSGPQSTEHTEEKSKKLPEAPKPEHDYTKLKQYISECRKQGFNNEEIKKALLKKKWIKDVVDEFFN